MKNFPRKENARNSSWSSHKKLNDSSQPLTDKVALPDECGDSLWEEVLAQKINESKKEIDNKEKLPAETTDQINKGK